MGSITVTTNLTSHTNDVSALQSFKKRKDAIKDEPHRKRQFLIRPSMIEEEELLLRQLRRFGDPPEARRACVVTRANDNMAELKPSHIIPPTTTRNKVLTPSHPFARPSHCARRSTI